MCVQLCFRLQVSERSQRGGQEWGGVHNCIKRVGVRTAAGLLLTCWCPTHSLALFVTERYLWSFRPLTSHFLPVLIASCVHVQQLRLPPAGIHT